MEEAEFVSVKTGEEHAYGAARQKKSQGNAN